uniref:Chitin-binding type-2 domain-containing protein n=1 Tax=Anopheles epiroticus TaxID=199890 RepID=A0A182PWD7_9DIPT
SKSNQHKFYELAPIRSPRSALVQPDVSDTVPFPDGESYQGLVGRPGIDFPVLTHIPKTVFDCKSHGNGYFADLETRCQVFHICDDGKKISFLCPNGTIFRQLDLICDWWFKIVLLLLTISPRARKCSLKPSELDCKADILFHNLSIKVMNGLLSVFKINVCYLEVHNNFTSTRYHQKILFVKCWNSTDVAIEVTLPKRLGSKTYLIETEG